MTTSTRTRHLPVLAVVATAVLLTGPGLTAPAAGADTTTGAAGAAIAVPDHLYAFDSPDPTGIPAEGPADVYPLTVDTTSALGRVTDLNLQVNGLTHTFPADLDLMLVAPDGRRAVVMSDVGGSGDLNSASFILDDEASNPMPDGPITEGSYRPSDIDVNGSLDPFAAPAPEAGAAGSALSVFDGTPAAGVWQVFLVDDAPGDSGFLYQVTLSLTTDAVASPYPSTIDVAGGGRVTDVDVTLHAFTSSYTSDLDLVLVGPSGQAAVLMSDAGQSSKVSGAELTFDDEAASALPARDLAGGRFRPTDVVDELDGPDTFPAPAPDARLAVPALSVFDGTDPHGTWQLFAVDDAADDTTTITAGWSLTVAATDPAPAPAPVPAPAPAPAPTVSATDTLAPRVGAVTPRGGSTRVARNRDVTVSFTEPVRRSTLTRSSVHLLRKGSTRPALATVTYAAGSRTATLDPARRLRPGTTYRIVVTTTVRDLAGNRLDQGSATGLQKLVRRFSTR